MIVIVIVIIIYNPNFYSHDAYLTRSSSLTEG